jgi:hypothetical protein
MSEDQNVGYRIWGVDNVVYGPVELPVLVSWVKEQRVTPTTWVYVDGESRWAKAETLSELAMFFSRTRAQSDGKTKAVSSDAMRGLEVGVLRRVKILAGFTDEELMTLLDLLEVVTVSQWAYVVRKEDHGDAMFLVLQGELRVRLMIDGRESILATLGAGDLFGEISLFDHGPRSADVLANVDSLLIKVSSVAFDKLMAQAPDLAARFLLATTRTLTARIRLDNKRYQDSIHLAHAMK